jgi:DNA polymerase-3 subunit epsilon
VAVVRVRGGQPRERFSTLVDPARPIPPAITRLTGISRASVEGAPTFEQAAPALLEFIGDAVVVAHNAPFDRAFLQAELRRAYNRSLVTPFLCTVRLARRLVPGLPSYRLDVLAAAFDLLIRDRHRALGDAEATAEILCRLLARLGPCSLRDLRVRRRAKAGAASAAARLP